MEHEMRRIFALVFAVFAVLALPALAATTIPPGKGEFVFVDAKGQPQRPIRVFTYRPARCDAACPIQVVLHGKSRRAANYRDYWVAAADRHGFLVLAPEFSRAHWSGDERYNHGDVRVHADPEQWTYSAIEHLFDAVRAGQTGYRLFGHSAGSQFVHRFMLLLPGNRATEAVAANAGRYVMPEWRKDRTGFAWPDSLAGSPAGEAELRRALQRRLHVMLGERDTDPHHKDLDQSPAARAQGPNRVARGETFFAAAQAAALELGVPLAWDLTRVPGVAHSGAGMSRAAAELLWGTKS